MPDPKKSSSTSDVKHKSVPQPSSKRNAQEGKNIHKDKNCEERRLRNIESAKRSRDRLKNESNWMHIQMNENEDRMSHLEKTVHHLTNELTSPPRRNKKSSSSVKNQNEDKVSWFGEPY